MKTLLVIAALSCFFAGLASASTDISWSGSGSVDTRPSIGGPVEIGEPSFPSPPIYSPPPFYSHPAPPSYDHGFDHYPDSHVEIRRYHRHRRHHYYYRHWDDEPVPYEIHEEVDAPVVRIEIPRPRYEPREEREEIDTAAVRELVGNILGVNFSARWNLENL